MLKPRVGVVCNAHPNHGLCERWDVRHGCDWYCVCDPRKRKHTKDDTTARTAASDRGSFPLGLVVRFWWIPSRFYDDTRFQVIAVREINIAAIYRIILLRILLRRLGRLERLERLKLVAAK